MMGMLAPLEEANHFCAVEAQQWREKEWMYHHQCLVMVRHRIKESWHTATWLIRWHAKVEETVQPLLSEQAKCSGSL